MESYSPRPVDLILTDPPFMPMNSAYEQIRENNDRQLEPIETPDREEYATFWNRCCNIWKDLLNPKGYLMFKSDDFTAREMYAVTTKAFKWRYTLIWNKRVIGLGYGFRKQHEIIDVYVRDGESTYWSQKPLHKTTYHGSSQGVAFRSILNYLAVRGGMHGNQSNQEHINQTPVELWKFIIPFVCPPDGVILDPFMGSGSVLSAVLQLNRLEFFNLKYYGIEKNRKFFHMAKDKLPGKNALDNFAQLGANI